MNKPGLRNGSVRPLRIAVDASHLGDRSHGLGRYLEALLPRMVALAGNDVQWILYARRRAASGHFPENVRQRCDHLPEHLGRLSSLILSQPWWLRLDRPDVFWAPAHRLPFLARQSCPCVVTIHDLAWLKAPETMRPLTRYLDKTLMLGSVAAARRVIAVSHSTAGDLQRQLPEAAAKTHVVYSAAETLPNAESISTHLPTLAGQVYFLCIGTQEPRKNLPRLIQGYAMALQMNPHLPHLVLAGGDGWGHNALPQLIRQHALEDRVTHLGAVSETRLATLYQHAFGLVMPSLYEGFGLPLVEAMHYGLPIITSGVGAMQEIAGDAALLVDPLSPASIAAALAQVSTDEEKRRALSAASRTRGRDFSWHEAAQSTLQLLLQAARE